MEKEDITNASPHVENAQGADKVDILEAELSPDARGYDLGEMPKGYYTSWRFIGSVAAISFLAQGLYLGYTLPANSFTLINQDIGPDPNYVLIPILKTLTGGVCLTLVGRLGDIFGRRWFMIGGAVFAIIGSIICATAHNINTVLAGTIFIGIAGAVQTSFSYVMMELVANKHRPYVTAFLFLTTFPLSTFGPVIARTLAARTALGWRWNYYLNLIDNALAAILLYLCYYPPSYRQLHEGKSMRQQLKQLDYGGIFLFTGGLVSLVLGISWGGGLYPWKSVGVILPIVLGVCVLVLFGFYEAYMPLTYPIVTMSMFKDRKFVSLAGVASVATMFFYSLTVIFPQMVSSLYETNYTLIGLMSGAVGGSVAFGQVIGSLTSRLGGTYWQIRISALLMCAFIGAMASCGVSTRDRAIAFTVLGGTGVGLVEVLAIIAVPFVVPASNIGLASGLLGSCRSTLGSIALAIFSSVLTTKKAQEIPPRVLAIAEEENLSETSTTAMLKDVLSGQLALLPKIPGISTTDVPIYIAAVKAGNVQVYKTVFLVSLVFGGAAVVCAFFTSGFDKHFDGRVERRMRGTGPEQSTKDKTVEEA